jgi:hypothetical protein
MQFNVIPRTIEGGTEDAGQVHTYIHTYIHYLFANKQFHIQNTLKITWRATREA